MRRHQFRYLLVILECYEKLQIYCSLNQRREKGVTAKTQAIQLIVKQSKRASNQSPRLFASTISKLIRGAVRVKRLLELAENNFIIVDAFPDLQINFFTGTRLNQVNFERWLKLVETNDLISIKEGKRLCDRNKNLASKMRKQKKFIK